MTPSQHPIEQEELMAYLDGELDAGQAASVAAHIAECHECQALAADLRTVSERLTAWQVEPSPARLAEGISQAVSNRSAEQKYNKTAKPLFKPISIPRRPFLRWAVGLSATGAALLLLFAISIPNLLRSRQAANQAQTGLSSPERKWGGEGDDGNESMLDQAQTPHWFLQPSGPMIARTANLTLVTKDFGDARAAVERIVREHQGYVAQLNVTGQSGTARYLTATLRVPADRLGAALAQLKKLGRVVQEAQNGEEVTAQYVDLNARLTNARTTERRLADILKNRTGKITDVLQVEREIARVRGEIERMDAERKNLENRVSYASVEVRVSEDYKASIEMTPPSAGSRLWNAAVDGYHGLVGSVLGLALAVLRYGPILLFWMILLFLPARLVWKRLRA
jgi:Domain of unknown function (DUF4349)/Putative zinc-finger